MKQLLTILCLVLLVSCSQEPEVFTGPFITRDDITYHQNTNEPVTGIVEEFHSNGQLQYRRNYKDGKEDGLWEWFYDNGQLWFTGNFIDGKPVGLWEYFDEDGNLTSTQTYRNGELVE